MSVVLSPAKPAALLTTREAAELLAVCERTLWELTRSGEIPCVRIRRSVRYRPESLSAYLTNVERSGRQER